MKGLLLALGKPGGSEPEGDDSPARTYAREAYTALRDKDEEGFVEALLALKSCSHGPSKPRKAKPEDDDADEGGDDHDYDE